MAISGEVARYAPSLHLTQCRLLRPALFGRIRTSGVETAALRRIERCRKVALQKDSLLLRFLFSGKDRSRGKQRPGIGMGGMIENLLLTSHLHNLPEIHHRHIVADEAHNAEIMGDEKIGQSHLFLHIL